MIFKNLNISVRIKIFYEYIRVLMISTYLDNFIIILRKLDIIQLNKANPLRKYNFKYLSKTKVIICY